MIVDTLVLQNRSARHRCAMAHVACGDIPWVLAVHAMEAAGNMVGRRDVEQVLLVAERRAPNMSLHQGHADDACGALLCQRSRESAYSILRGPSQYRVAEGLSTEARRAGARHHL